MGVITQKDIVKIINSSVNNIQLVIDTLATNISKVTKSANTATLKDNLNLFTEIEKFISEYVKVMDIITNTIPKLKFSKMKARMALNSVNNIMDVILKFVNSLTDEAFKKFDPKQLLTRLEDIKNIVISVESLFKSTSSMVKNSLVIILFGWMVKLSIRIIISIVKTIIKLSSLSVSKDKEKAFLRLKTIFDGIYDISKKLIKLIPLSVVATIGAIVTVVFVLELCVFILAVGLLSKAMRVVSKQTTRGIRRMSKIFKALIWCSIWILVLAIAAHAVSVALLIVIALVLILMLSMAILAIALFLTGKLAKFARKQAIRIAWSLILICGIFIIMCLAIVLAGIAGTIMLQDGAVLKVIIGLVAIAVMLGLFIIIGKIMGKAEKHLASLKTSLVPLLGVLGLIALIIVELVALALFGEFLMQGNHIMNIIIGLVAVIIVGVLVTLLGVLLSKATQYLVIAQAAMMPLLMILGLLALAGLALVVFAASGAFVRKNIGNIIFGLLAILIVAGIIVLVAIGLGKANALIAAAAGLISPLMVTMALMGLAALSIVAFGLVGKYVKDHIEDIVYGLTAILIVAGVLIGVGIGLAQALPYMAISTAAITPLLIVFGLFVAAGLSIVLFGEIGKYLQENILYVLAGFAAIILVAAVMVGLGMALMLAMPLMAVTISAAIPLIIVFGLFVVAGLSIVMFGKIGQYLEENIMYVLAGFAAIVLVALAMIGLGIALTAALPFMILTLVVALIYAAAMGMLIVVGLAINKFGETDLLTVQDVVLGNIASVAIIGLAIAGLGVAMIPIAVGCVLLMALIMPLLGAVILVALAVKSIEIISEAKIDNNAVDKNIQSISLFWKSVKKLLDTFKLKDLFLFSFALIVCATVSAIALTIEKIAERLQKISSIELDEPAILGNVEKIFNCVTDLATKVEELLTGPAGNSPLFDVPETGFFSFFKKKKPTAKDKLDNVKKILATLTGITFGLNQIQKFTLDEEKILSTVETIFNFISVLAEKIKTCLFTTSLFDDKVIKERTWWGGTREKTVKNKSLEKLDNVSKVTGILKEITFTLNTIQKFTIDEEKILSNVDIIFKFIATLSEKIKTHLFTTSLFDDKIVEETTWWGGTETHVEKNKSVEKLDNVSKIVSLLGGICTALKSIQKLTIDEDKIRGNVEYVFGFIADLCGFIEENMSGLNVFEDKVTWKWVEGGWFSSGYWEKQVEENQTAKKIGDIEKVVASMGRILESLKLMSEVELTDDVKSTIKANITNIFDYISEIALMVNDLLDPNSSGLFGANSSIDTVKDSLQKSKIADTINEKSSEYAEKLGSVGQIFKTLNDILDSLNKIKEIKFTQKDSQRIQDNIGTLFNAVEYIIGVTNERLQELGGQTIDTENLDIIVEGITKITDTVEEINNLKLTDFKTNTKSIVDFLTKLSNISLDESKTNSIDKSLSSLATFLYKTDKAIFASNNRLTFMERVNGVIKSLGDVTPDQVNRSKEMIKHQIAYLDKVNNIDISKLKTSAQMVESMAKLSKSIRGNFEGLAESINEDLMPVLKELKEIMEKIPEKLDTGFQNTSASIGAINNTPTTEGFAAQIRRENPRLSNEQTEAAAKSRMVDAARRLSGNRTITDLYNLFAGDIAGTKAKVRIG